MSNWRKIAERSTVLFCVLLTVSAVARSQTPAAREDNRTLDEYDRTLNVMKNDAKQPVREGEASFHKSMKTFSASR